MATTKHAVTRRPWLTYGPEDRPVGSLVPSGSTAIPARSGGTCIICGEKKSASQLLLRRVHWDYEEERHVGFKVCVECSPHVSDETVDRYSREIDDWSYRELQHLDGEVA